MFIRLNHVLYRDRTAQWLYALPVAAVLAIIGWLFTHPKPEAVFFQVRESAIHHFWVDGVFNGITTDCMIDTGATVVTIPKSFANQLGLHPTKFSNHVHTGNGTVDNAPVVIDRLTIANITLTYFDVDVAGGGLDKCIVGMNWLSLVDLSVKDGVLTIKGKGA